LRLRVFMEHHRSHEGRELHVHPSRTNDTPPEGPDRQRGSDGSEYAPTRKAAEREHERHNIERDLGRTAAGTHGALRGTRDATITRADLDEAARIADVSVGPSRTPKRSARRSRPRR
jgi:hypothetical protein